MPGTIAHRGVNCLEGLTQMSGDDHLDINTVNYSTPLDRKEREGHRSTQVIVRDASLGATKDSVWEIPLFVFPPSQEGTESQSPGKYSSPREGKLSGAKWQHEYILNIWTISCEQSLILANHMDEAYFVGAAWKISNTHFFHSDPCMVDGM